MISDFALFLKQAVLQPRQTSSLVPSSRALASAMARNASPHSGGVVEFGPGTGRITEAILQRGIAPSDLTLIEMNPQFAAQMKRRYPGVAVHVAGAQDVARYCSDVMTVISGLPLLSMPKELRHEIIRAAFSVLRPDGSFVQFTYGTRPPLKDATLHLMGLTAEKSTKVWANLPPAQVYVLRRKAA